jgi:ferritin-like metal-binding protein YciE
VIANPRDLLLHDLSELLWIERTLFFTVIPAVHDAAHDERLQLALTEHRAQTRIHCVRVEEAVRTVGAEPAAAASPPLEKLAQQHDETARSITHPVLRDVFHCAGVVRTEHYELACYDAVLGLARELDLKQAVRLLRQNRDEDAAALERAEKLSRELYDFPKP